MVAGEADDVEPAGVAEQAVEPVADEEAVGGEGDSDGTDGDGDGVSWDGFGCGSTRTAGLETWRRMPVVKGLKPGLEAGDSARCGLLPDPTTTVLAAEPVDDGARPPLFVGSALQTREAVELVSWLGRVSPRAWRRRQTDVRPVPVALARTGGRSQVPLSAHVQAHRALSSSPGPRRTHLRAHPRRHRDRLG